MRRTKRDSVPVFSVADHLKVQQQIEKRAHEIWCMRRHQQDTALDDWLRAEREVLEDFIMTVTTHNEH